MYDLDEALISYASRGDALVELQKEGVSEADFTEDYRAVWRYLVRTKADLNTTPSPDVVKARFPDLNMPRVRDRDVPLLLHNLRQRRKYKTFLTALHDAASSCTDFEQVDNALQLLQGELNNLSMMGAKKAHLRDLFAEDTIAEFIAEVADRRSGRRAGIPTGFAKFDSICGGLHKQTAVSIIGRTGIGKSWIDLYFVANAVINGYKVVLYPLEMNLFDTAARLHTIFTQQMYGASKVLKNHDLTSGRVSTQRVQRFLSALQDKFAGQLLVADVSSLSDPYTVERIEAETELNKPDMIWVDYITLLKTPDASRNEAEYVAVRKLSHGIKNIAMRRDVVSGVSAQVNREALKVKSFLPRIEHIAYGDSIGQDMDQVFAINRKDEYLYWALVKHRGGPEIGKTKTLFRPNDGLFVEQDDEAEDDE